MPEPGEQAVPGGARLRVMIADDDELVRILARAVIEEDESLTLVGEATDTDEAVALAVREKPDVAVLDWSMPGGGGTEAARLISSRSPATGIVAFTATDQRNATAEMREAGAAAVVVKGGAPDELLEAIRAAARR